MASPVMKLMTQISLELLFGENAKCVPFGAMLMEDGILLRPLIAQYGRLNGCLLYTSDAADE